MESQRIQDPVELWLRKATRIENTRKHYRKKLLDFMAFCGSTPGEVVSHWKEIRYGDPRLKEQFIEEWSERVEDYAVTLESYTPKTRVTYLASITSFFSHNRIPLEVEFEKNTYVKYHNRDIKKEEIRRVLDNASIRDRAFYLTMLESGLRPDTITQLRYKYIKEDFEAERVPMKLDLPAELLKDRVGHRFSFIGEDGFRCLKEYLSPRLPLRDDELVFVHEKRAVEGKPVSPEAFSSYFNRIVLKLGLDTRVEGRKPKALRLYCLRKYFRNHIGVDMGFREFWMGHSFGTDEHYITRDPERHREEYAKAYHNIRIYETGIPQGVAEKLTSQEERIRQLEEENRRLKESQLTSEKVREMIQEKTKELEGRLEVERGNWIALFDALRSKGLTFEVDDDQLRIVRYPESREKKRDDEVMRTPMHPPNPKRTKSR